MRKIRLKFPITEFDGTFYEVRVNVSRQQEEETEWKSPDKVRKLNGESSEAQKAWRRHFEDAHAYVAVARANPKIWAFYEAEAEKQNKQPHNLAMSDYLNGKNLWSK